MKPRTGRRTEQVRGPGGDSGAPGTFCGDLGKLWQGQCEQCKVKAVNSGKGCGSWCKHSGPWIMGARERFSRRNGFNPKKEAILTGGSVTQVGTLLLFSNSLSEVLPPTYLLGNTNFPSLLHTQLKHSDFKLRSPCNCKHPFHLN